MVVVKFTPAPPTEVDKLRVTISQGSEVNEQEYLAAAVITVEGSPALDITAQVATVTFAGASDVRVASHVPGVGWGPAGVAHSEVFPGQYTVTDVKEIE